MSLAAVIKRRTKALIEHYVRDPLIQVQAEGPHILPRLVFLDDGGRGATSEKLGRRSDANVALVRRAGNPDTEACVWVASNYSGYRDTWLAFVNEVYGLDAKSADLTGYDVDHLLNRARSPQNTTMIRIEAVPAQANQEWGRLFEKASSDPRFYANQARERRTMSWMICAKLAGEMPPRGPGDTDGIDRLGNFFARVGLDGQEAREGIASMLTHAYQFR